MPINPLSGRSPRSLARPLQPPSCRHQHWKGAPASQIIFLAVFRSENGRIEGQSDSERAWLDGGTEEGCWFGSALERRDTAEFATIHFFHLLPRSTSAARSGGRSQHKVPGENPRTTTSSSLDLGFKGRKRSLGWPPDGGRATHALPVAQSLSSVVQLSRDYTEGEEGGTQSDSYFQNSSRRRARSI